ncbi:hypothetical protein AB0D22_06890 [Kitasatospora sp. NPDC048538]|uniref:hypothetical protein n=1 Tax=Kitasatospora sp. NPDC048538 TaxID=3155633 RepID=UPI0033DA3BFC
MTTTRPTIDPAALTSAATTVAPEAGATVEIGHWNIQHGRHTAQAVAWLLRRAEANGFLPAALMLNELVPGQGKDVAAAFGMRYFPAPLAPVIDEETDSRRRHLNAIFIDPNGPLVPDSWMPNWAGPWLPPATLPVRLRDEDGTLSPRRLFLACEHACYWNPQFREATARFFTSLAKDGELLHVDGDWNAWTVGRAPLRMDGIADRAFAANRSVWENGRWAADVFADRLLTAHGCFDVHRYAAGHLGIADAYLPTTGHTPDKARQAVPACDVPAAGLAPIDRTYASDELATAVVDARVIADPGADELSDHRPRFARYSHQGLAQVMNRGVQVIHH